MKYINKKSNEVATVLSTDNDRKTVTIQLKDGSTKTYSATTMKRNWTEVVEDVESPIEEEVVESAEVTNTFSKKAYTRHSYDENGIDVEFSRQWRSIDDILSQFDFKAFSERLHKVFLGMTAATN